MKRILIIGDGNSPFITDYAIWLKRKGNYIIDLFSYTTVKNENKAIFDQLLTNKFNRNNFIYKIKYVRGILPPFLVSNALFKALKLNNVIYDIIHIHWITETVVLNSDKYKKYTKSLVATFWGDEPKWMRLLLSNRLYHYKLRKFIQNTDCILGANNSKYFCDNLLKDLHPNYHYASFGSTPMEILHNELLSKNRIDAKKEFGINCQKISVAICYSGKLLHQQIKIIKALKNSKYYNLFREKIQLLAPMTYGSSVNFCKQVENELKNLGIEYQIYYDTYWSNQQVATFRMTADVILQLSKSDAASNSIREFLCAGSIMLAGDWLRYDIFKEEGFKFIQVEEFDGFDEVLKDVIMDFERYKTNYSRFDPNYPKEFTWERQIDNWIEAYKLLEKND